MESKYRWAEEQPYCLAVVQELSLEEAAAHLSATPYGEQPRTLLAEFGSPARSPQPYVLQLQRLASGTVIIEPFGAAAVTPQYVRALARVGLTAFYWSVNMDMAFIVARKGEIIRNFDPIMWQESSGYGEPLAEEADLGETAAASALTAGLVLFERLTGLGLTEDFVLGTPRMTFSRPPA